MDVQIGSIVISKAGRDKGYFLAVVGMEGNLLAVADGKERPIGRPKQKNLRHLSITGFVLNAEQMHSDKSLRRERPCFTLLFRGWGKYITANIGSCRLYTADISVVFIPSHGTIIRGKTIRKPI